MEAKLNVQANMAVNVERNTTNRPAPAAAATPPVRGTAAPNINFNPTVTKGAAEDLVSLDIPVPYGESEITQSVIDRYVKSVNEALAPSFFRLNASIHEATNRVMVQVIDTNTEEILREIPPESRLDIIAKMHEFAGLLYDEVG